MKKFYKRKNKIIINADDYGMSPLFNKGILELAKKNIISSFSVMIKRKFINPSDLNNLKNISIGLHLELKEKETLKEINKQIQLFVKILGRLPSHLDGHKHMHLTQENLPKVIRMAKKYRLPVRSHLTEDRKKLEKSMIKTPENFIGWHPRNLPVLKEKLKNVNNKVTELVCHPGFYDNNSISSYNIQREWEFNFLTSRKFKKLINKFTKINYAKL